MPDEDNAPVAGGTRHDPRHGLSGVAEPLVEAAVRLRVERIVKLLEGAVSERPDLPPFEEGEAEHLVDGMTRHLMRRYAAHADEIFGLLLDLVAEATVASEVSYDGSLRLERTYCSSVVRLKVEPAGAGKTPAERSFHRALQRLRGATRGGSRTGPGWRSEDYMKFAEEVMRTSPLFAEALRRLRDDDDFDDVIAEIATKRKHRRPAHADVSDNARCEPVTLALRHAARVKGLEVSTQAVLQKYYDTGAELLIQDAPYGVLDLVDPAEIEVEVEETLWPG